MGIEEANLMKRCRYQQVPEGSAKRRKGAHILGAMQLNVRVVCSSDEEHIQWDVVYKNL